MLRLPDISNWKTDNLKNIKNIFYGCESLILLPDISKWKIKEVSYLKDFFSSNGSEAENLNLSTEIMSSNYNPISYTYSSDKEYKYIFTNKVYENNYKLEISNDNYDLSDELKSYYENFYN